MAPKVCSFTGLELANLPLGDKQNQELNSKIPYLTFSRLRRFSKETLSGFLRKL